MDDARQLLLLLLFRATRTLAAGLIAVAFPYYVLTQFHYSAFTFGLLYAAATIATAILALLLGYSADVWSRKWTLLIAGILLPLGALLAFASGRLPILFAACILGGFSARRGHRHAFLRLRCSHRLQPHALLPLLRRSPPTSAGLHERVTLRITVCWLGPPFARAEKKTRSVGERSWSVELGWSCVEVRSLSFAFLLDYR